MHIYVPNNCFKINILMVHYQYFFKMYILSVYSYIPGPYKTLSDAKVPEWRQFQKPSSKAHTFATGRILLTDTPQHGLAEPLT